MLHPNDNPKARLAAARSVKLERRWRGPTTAGHSMLKIRLAAIGSMATVSRLMGTFEVVVGAVVLAVLAFQVWLTVRVHKSKLYEPTQKVWQTQLIWLLPVIGAGLVFSILHEDEQANRPSSQLKS